MLNKIVDCNYGVLALSSDPYIFMNNISKSQENGILIKTKNLLRSDALIKYNTVEKNLEYGIVLEGAENYTRVEKNHHINANRKAGIRISEQANVKVLNNRIFGNYGQGILVQESAAAYIEKNEIFQNYKANLAFGGNNSGDTVVLNNLIYKSRSEGIFVIEGGFSWIKHNDIFDNADGILLFDSCPHISNNQIHENQRSGIICSGSSYPLIEQNQIFGNNQTGISIRDNSQIGCKENKMFANNYQLSVGSMSAKDQKRLMKRNAIEGLNEFYNNTCYLF